MAELRLKVCLLIRKEVCISILTAQERLLHTALERQNKGQQLGARALCDSMSEGHNIVQFYLKQPYATLQAIHNTTTKS